MNFFDIENLNILCSKYRFLHSIKNSLSKMKINLDYLKKPIKRCFIKQHNNYAYKNILPRIYNQK